VLDLACPDAKRQGTKGAMGRRMAVAADDCLAWLRESTLRPDHVHDPVAAVAESEELHPELLAVGLQLIELRLRLVVDDPQRLRKRRRRVVHRRDGLVRAANL